MKESWVKLDSIIVFGLGNIAEKGIKKLAADFRIICIIDNDKAKQGNDYNTIPILSLEEARKYVGVYKIIVCTAGKNYITIAQQLKGEGLIEQEDFCSIEWFLADWYWENRKQNCLLEIHTAVTMRCTFKCKNCNMFVPYYKNIVDYSNQEILNDMKLLFDRIDSDVVQ